MQGKKSITIKSFTLNSAMLLLVILMNHLATGSSSLRLSGWYSRYWYVLWLISGSHDQLMMKI
ncbi:MAG: hypothetical protein WBQ25_11655 [Nitrososphaeraceae archaeon]